MPPGLSDLLTIASALLSAGIFVIQLMTRNAVLQLKLEMMEHVRAEYASNDRVDGLETRIETLEQRRPHASTL